MRFVKLVALALTFVLAAAFFVAGQQVTAGNSGEAFALVRAVYYGFAGLFAVLGLQALARKG